MATLSAADTSFVSEGVLEVTPVHARPLPQTEFASEGVFDIAVVHARPIEPTTFTLEGVFDSPLVTGAEVTGIVTSRQLDLLVSLSLTPPPPEPFPDGVAKNLILGVAEVMPKPIIIDGLPYLPD